MFYNNASTNFIKVKQKYKNNIKMEHINPDNVL